MKKKKIIVFFAVFLIIVIGVIFLIFSNRKNERTNDEYISILLENKEDFECVAQVMQQWSEGSIDFNNGISSANQQIENEITNNDDFKTSLLNLYDLKEISYILIEGDTIAFYFSKFPADYHGGVFYGKNIEENFGTYTIDEDWVLKMIPNV